MASSKQGTGRFGEIEAAACLERLGYRIRERNYRTRLGEIDLIAEEGEFLVFAEVKARTGLVRGLPREAVDRRKRRRMTRAAVAYVNALDHPPPWRFDVVEVVLVGGAAEVRVCRDAFQVEEQDLRGLE